MPSPNDYLRCRAAASCGDGSVFTLSSFTEAVWGTTTGTARTGAGGVLGRLAKAGLVRKLGKNSFGELLFELTPRGLKAANADPLEVAQPVVQPTPASTRTAPSPDAAKPPSAEWNDARGVRWSIRAGWACWQSPNGSWVAAYPVHTAPSR